MRDLLTANRLLFSGSVDLKSAIDYKIRTRTVAASYLYFRYSLLSYEDLYMYFRISSLQTYQFAQTQKCNFAE